MSGLEGIAGLGLACNVMQLISFGHEAVSMCQRIYESGSPEPGLAERAQSLISVCDSLSKSLGKEATPAPAAHAARPPTMEKRLLDIAAKCIKNARDLEEEMKFLSPDQPGRLGVLVAAPKILWRKKRLDRLRRDLNAAQKLMDTSILERLFARAETLYRINDKGFSDLSEELRQFIADYAKSTSILRDVFQTQAREIQDHMTMESSNTQQAIKSHVSLDLANHEVSVNNHASLAAQGVQDTLLKKITSREDSEAKEQAYQQLLKSLKYPAMNERRNQVSQSHPKTFRWILRESMHLGCLDPGNSTHEDSSTYSAGSDNVNTTSPIPGKPFNLPVRFTSAFDVDRTMQPQNSFVGWLKNSTCRRYWISGKPGSGKSTLMRYLETNKKTMRYCKFSTRCISHYLWRPGTFMQHSIKGLLCSLLHQILTEDQGDAMRILESQPTLTRKDAVTDWTTKELEITLLSLIRRSSCTYLVFLDGLDEVADTPDEGIGRLSRLIDDLVATNHIKMCLSSRPDPVLKRILEIYPMLKIQDLTKRDIHLLSRDRLGAMGMGLDNNMAENLSKLICEKAEGVFIWVILVLNSLQRGLANYDDVDTLYRRVESLPKDLTKLYREMWSRMKEDSDIYRRKSVLLLYMAMEIKLSFHGSSTWNRLDNLLGLVISTDDEILESFTARHEIPNTEQLWQKWYRLGRALPAICAGLLDITEPEEAFSPRNTHKSRFQAWGKTGIRFTHRTAIDFICNSDEGRELFCAYVPKQDDLLLRAIKTNLLLRRIYIRTDNSTTMPINDTIRQPEYELRVSITSIPSFSPYHLLAESSSRRTINNLLSFTYQCLSIISLDLAIRQPGKLHECFLAAAFKEVNFCDWAEETLQAETAGVEEVTWVESNALRYGCEGLTSPGRLGLPEVDACRLSMIQRVLRKYATYRQRLKNSMIRPVHRTCSRDILKGWRCFLANALDQALQRQRGSAPPYDEDQLRWWSNIAKVIHYFSSAKVTEDSKDRTCMISIRLSSCHGINLRSTMSCWSSGILCEINDVAILALLIQAAQKVLGPACLLEFLAEPICSRIAAPKLLHEGIDPRSDWLGILGYSDCYEVLQEGSMDGQQLLTLAMEGKIQNLDDLTSTSGGPSIIQVRKIGRYRDHVLALRSIGYETGTVIDGYVRTDDEVNRGYELG